MEGNLQEKSGGAEGDRTPDLSIANAALSQLSYGPMSVLRSREGESCVDHLCRLKAAVKKQASLFALMRPCGAEQPCTLAV